MNKDRPVRLIGTVSFATVLLTGSFVGLLDGVGAIIQYLAKGGKQPAVIFYYIASGLFGKTAYTGGTIMLIAGVLLHLLIALCWTCLYFCIFNRVAFVRQQRIISGILYGVFIWGIMNFVVLPVSYVHQQPFKLSQAVIAIGILIAAIGLPLSFIAGRLYKHSSIKSIC